MAAITNIGLGHAAPLMFHYETTLHVTALQRDRMKDIYKSGSAVRGTPIAA